MGYQQDMADWVNEYTGAMEGYWREHPEEAHFHRLISLLAEGFAIGCEAMKAHYPCLSQALNVFAMLHTIRLVDRQALDDLYRILKPHLEKIYPPQNLKRAESREFPPPPFEGSSGS